jgi:organic radical activating enzyme
VASRCCRPRAGPRAGRAQGGAARAACGDRDQRHGGPLPAIDPLIDQFNVSPKLAHSGNPADLALIPERLAAWAAEPRAFFKFVVASPDDCAEVAALQAQYAIPGARLFVMPEGTDSETLRRREKWLSALALEHGWRMTDRLHIHLYGDTRGT